MARAGHIGKSIAGTAIGKHAPPAPGVWRTVCALGIAQIVSWGTLFYTIAVLGPAMRDELGIGDIALFGSFTCGLLVSGLVSPFVGRRIDAHGGRQVLAAGSMLGALAMMVLAIATGPLVMLAGWLLAGMAMAACLYDPAFATLHRIAGTSYRRTVTALTLFGGFASTVFWPLSQYLLDSFGWRTAFGTYAVLHLVVCLPLHGLFVPGSPAEPQPAKDDATSALAPFARGSLVWLATALSLAAFLGSALAAHVIGLMTSSGLSARDAVLIGSLIGPMQVAGRVVEFTVGRRLPALAVGTLAFALMAAALALLTQVRGVWIAAIAFAILYGGSNGVMTIVRGTVPAELFGQRGYGTLLGRLALPQFLAKAMAPLALALLFTFDPTRTTALYALALTAVAALFAYRLAIRAR
ncbi:MAG: MFS transporter [Betaproteobacteria bacterium]|nr:MFS transporter [Betaproteobacteria bacterium]